MKLNSTIEWQEVNKSWWDFSLITYETRNDPPPVKPGMLLDTSIGILLVGDINDAGGVCDDCKGIRNDDIVKRVAIIYEKDTE
jgi:hypothetical protein